MSTRDREVYQAIVNIVVEKFKRHSLTGVSLRMLQDDLNYHLQYTFDNDKIALEVTYSEETGIVLVPCEELKNIFDREQ